MEHVDRLVIDELLGGCTVNLDAEPMSAEHRTTFVSLRSASEGAEGLGCRRMSCKNIEETCTIVQSSTKLVSRNAREGV